MAEVQSTFTLQIGDPAPDFSLPDAFDREYSLDEVAGEKGTLVIFACNHCPYVIHLAEAIGELAEELLENDINTVAINSNDIVTHPEDDPENMGAFADEYGWDFPYLFDEDQEIAKAYGAACTPDFFLFDEDQNLIYAGQFDGSRPKNSTEITGRDIRTAVKSMLIGEGPVKKMKPSSGCNIKWKAGNEPEYFNK